MKAFKQLFILALVFIAFTSCNQKDATLPTDKQSDEGTLKNAPYCGYSYYDLKNATGETMGTLEVFNASATTYFTFTPDNFDENAVVSFQINGNNYTNFYSTVRSTSIRSYVDGLGGCVSTFSFAATIGDLTAVGDYTFECCCWGDGETGWSYGNRYNKRGNWATYTPYTAGATITKTLYAGQTKVAGAVKFEPNGSDVKITITLSGNWGFNPDESENVKIQDYAVAPSGNPAPGQFAYKYFGENAVPSPYKSINTVPFNNFYGVHVDLVQGVICEGEEE